MHFPPNFVHRTKTPFVLLSHPPTTASGGRPVALGPPAIRAPGARGRCVYTPPVPRACSGLPNRYPPRIARLAPPRVGQVSFVSSLDTNRNILTDSYEVAIVAVGGRNHGPPYRKAVGHAPNSFRDALAYAATGSMNGGASPLKMGV